MVSNRTTCSVCLSVLNWTFGATIPFETLIQMQALALRLDEGDGAGSGHASRVGSVLAAHQGSRPCALIYRAGLELEGKWTFRKGSSFSGERFL